MTLDKLISKAQLKKLTVAELKLLATDIRKFLITSISTTGGHLASNLGVVELTLALHTVFDTPKDKIIWDVGHQSYVHKILTGRKSGFFGLRQLDGLSGFPKTSESKHDTFNTGHSSTSVSAALGMAAARDLMGKKHHVIAVIGDGSMTGGLAFEGLNNAGRSESDLLVILNDNQMSIGQNVGGISKHFNKLRTTSGYLGAKRDVRTALNHLPVVGKPLARGIESAKNLVKYAVLPGVLFEELGFRYFGPINGHDIEAMEKVLEQTKKIKGPVLVHVLTKKGKGYKIAEKSPASYHGIGVFDIATGQPRAAPAPKYTDVFKKAMVRAGERNKNVVAISAAMADGTGLQAFAKKFPRRFFDVGIAEGHAVTFAAGLAKAGLRPVVAVYSSFLQRAYDNVLHDVAVQNLPVVFAIDRAGVVPAEGETHQGLYDYAYLSHIPNMTVLAPSTDKDLEAMLAFALQHPGPVSIRYPNATATPADSASFVPGAVANLVAGKDVVIVSVGAMLDTAKAAVEKLQAMGYQAALYDAQYVNPIPASFIAAINTSAPLFVIEDAAQKGGYGERLHSHVNVTKTFALPDKFIEAGTRDEIFTRYGLTADAIASAIASEITPN